jgi:hypothetical protein
LCVLANPTLLCIWDVYPTATSDTSTRQQPSQSQSQVHLGSGEGHHLPLPFEASGIFAVGNNQHGLIVQRCETAEDLFAFDRGSWNNTSTTGEKEGRQQQQQQDDDDDDDDDDDGFILKAPPRPVRLRDSIGGSTLASLNVSTATSSPSTVGPSNVPSLFSLQHPMGDIVPVSTFVDDETVQTGPVTDVFEKILFVGVMKWVDDDPNIPYLERKERSHPVCVTYHTQLNR